MMWDKLVGGLLVIAALFLFVAGLWTDLFDDQLSTGLGVLLLVLGVIILFPAQTTGLEDYNRCYPQDEEDE